MSCTTSKINVEKGTFQAIKPPNIYGNSRYLEEWNHASEGKHNIISFNANIGKNKTIPLPGVINSYYHDEDITMQETPANINYRLIENTLGFQFYEVTKEDSPFYTGFGGGVQNFPYGFLMLGHNWKFMEIGGAVFLGLTIDKASYEGEWGYSDACGLFVWCGEYEYIKLEDIKVLHPYGGLVAHVSFYWEKFALNYAASVSEPWLAFSLPSSHMFTNADISFSFPVLLMQDIGISYTPHKIKYRLGVNQITGVKFPGQYWGLSVQVAYGW
jgi:hypothetical protein